MIPTKDAPESEETKRMWIYSYLERKHELEGHQPSDVSDTEVELWMTALKITDVVNTIIVHHLACQLITWLNLCTLIAW